MSLRLCWPAWLTLILTLHAHRVEARPAWAGALALDLSGYHLSTPEPTDALLAGLGARGAVGSRFFGYRAGLDARFGPGLQGGFAYDTSLLPLGFSLPLTYMFSLGISAGIGANGVTGRIPATARVPIELALQFHLTRGILVGLWLTPAYTFANARKDGSTSLTWTDEFDAGFLLRFGKGNQTRDMIWGNGTYVAVQYGERFGARLGGFAVGHALDLRSNSRR